MSTENSSPSALSVSQSEVLVVVALFSDASELTGVCPAAGRKIASMSKRMSCGISKRNNFMPFYSFEDFKQSADYADYTDSKTKSKHHGGDAGAFI
jgi:hypothetical protein